MPVIEFQIKNQVATITLNRPEKYNAIIEEMALDIQKYLDECAGSAVVRVVLIKAEGKAFCAGQDLGEFADDDSRIGREVVDTYYNPIVRKLASLEKPVICAVQGVAAGAGANLALSCDIVIAGRSARFIQAFSKIGLIPDTGGSYYLPRLIGLPRALAYTMLADTITAEKAEEIGMIYQMVEDEELASETDKLCLRLARAATRGLGLTKMALRAALSNDLDSQLELESRLQGEATKTSDFQEGVKAFIEKREPTYSGN